MKPPGTPRLQPMQLVRKLQEEMVLPEVDDMDYLQGYAAGHWDALKKLWQPLYIYAYNHGRRAEREKVMGRRTHPAKDSNNDAVPGPNLPAISRSARDRKT